MRNNQLRPVGVCANMKGFVLSTLTTLLLLGGTDTASAQRYFNAFGMRFGNDIGLTYQQRIAKRWTVEAILNRERDRDLTMFTLLGERHQPLIGKRLNFYVGGGFHRGFIGELDDGTDPGDPFGVTAIGGLEFTLGRLNATFDVKPAINLTNAPDPIFFQSGLSVRYVIGKNRVWKDLADRKKKRQKTRRKAQRREDGLNWRFWERD